MTLSLSLLSLQHGFSCRLKNKYATTNGVDIDRPIYFPYASCKRSSATLLYKYLPILHVMWCDVLKRRASETKRKTNLKERERKDAVLYFIISQSRDADVLERKAKCSATIARITRRANAIVAKIWLAFVTVTHGWDTREFYIDFDCLYFFIRVIVKLNHSTFNRTLNYYLCFNKISFSEWMKGKYAAALCWIFSNNAKL